MKQYKIASLGTGNKVAYMASGHRVFVPQRFRESINVGDFIITTVATFTKRTNPETLELEDCAPFDREGITMVGDFKSTTLAIHEDRVNAGVAEDIVNSEIKALKAKFSLKEEDVLKAIGA